MISEDIRLDEIDNNPLLNCRGFISPSDVDHLIEDIKKHGLIQPIIVKHYQLQVFNHPIKYRLIAGFSRYEACKALGWVTIPCIIRDCTDEEALFINLNENLVRKDLNIMQEAKALERIMKKADYSVEQLAERLNKKINWVQVRIYFLKLREDIQEELAKLPVTQDQIRTIYNMRHLDEQYLAVRKIKEAQQRGIRVDLKYKPPVADAKRPRERAEIFAMQDHIRENVGNSIGTKCLAWAAGEISDSDLYKEVGSIAEAMGISYEAPIKEAQGV